ncbi:DUF6876 family protein [Xenophilus sp. Marseille-Q4582]|uniref:DUF6876 family protein n=1 Tax=Xenophilus sp. Marseille-Q4582 TaxID=2866600 RepID=UPI001CE42FB0|nr:DUF6876 family protein [Xenophilus sp. Marseille-Q4582]
MDGPSLKQLLTNFTGSARLFRHSFVRRFTYTEGVRAFAQHAGGGAYWFLDILATEPKIQNHFRKDSFASVRLKVYPPEKGGCTITVDDGNGNLVYFRDIEYTDCPPHPATQDDSEPPWLFFMELGYLDDVHTSIVLMLPSER